MAHRRPTFTEAYQLVPHLGVAGVRFGMPRGEVIARATARGWVLQHERPSSLVYGFESAGPAISFGSDGVDHIEFAAAATTEVTYRGINVFDTPAPQLVKLNRANEQRLGYDDAPPYVEHGLQLLRGEIITLYDAAKQYDYWGGHRRNVYFKIGIGSRGYYAALVKQTWKPPRPSSVGAARYKHAKFGLATLVSLEEDTLELLFDDGVLRRLKSAFVERVDA
jgi:hypothetical protein